MAVQYANAETVRVPAGAAACDGELRVPELATGLVIFLAGLPISIHAARHGLDMDLLTRGAGFGYIGSTLTSLIYASFTFIFFALEAAVMAYALELALGIPPVWGYLLCAVVVIPLLFMGSLLTESFFGIPGLGSYTIDAIQAQDFAVVRSMVFIGSLLYILGLLLTDLSYTVVDPRIRFD